MKNLKHYYLFKIQFLGFRYHGWQKQSLHRTVQGTIEKNINKIFPNDNAKIVGGSRTDSMVSAEEYTFILILKDEVIGEFAAFIENLNYMLPADIRLLKIHKLEQKINIIQNPKLKEYRYYFSFGSKKPHPMAAPIITHIQGNIDLELMRKGASEFIGTHNFRKYCYKPHAEKIFEKTIDQCSVEVNDFYQANFFPEETFYIKVVGHSFMRHQVRFMAGTLFKLGLGEISLEELIDSLQGHNGEFIGFLAPASGLVLHGVELDLEDDLLLP
jgi:tRNA pseudouridine38-40 synthase